MLRRGFQLSRLGAALVGMISLASEIWIPLFDDLSSVILRQPTSVLDKNTKEKFGTTTHRSEGLFDCVHVSIWGPAKTVSLGGDRYFIFFIDNLSRHCWICPHETKI